MFLWIAGLFLLVGSPLVSAADKSATTIAADIVDSYKGGFKDDYPQELVRVRSYVLPIQSEIATQLGLQYGQGFLHPVAIRFEDGAPAVSENPYFYVRRGPGNEFNQELVVNVEAYARHRSEWQSKEGTLRGGFRYTMTQIMLNDIFGGEGGKALPLWVQEGLAMYVSGDGETVLQSVAGRVRKSRVADMVSELNNPGPYLTPKDSAIYYLAIKYIAGQGALQAFVRNLVDGKSPADTIRDSMSLEWSSFTDNVRSYSTRELSANARPDEEESNEAPRQKNLR